MYIFSLSNKGVGSLFLNTCKDQEAIPLSGKVTVTSNSAWILYWPDSATEYEGKLASVPGKNTLLKSSVS